MISFLLPCEACLDVTLHPRLSLTAQPAEALRLRKESGSVKFKHMVISVPLSRYHPNNVS
jgi:hypothetical protein